MDCDIGNDHELDSDESMTETRPRTSNQMETNSDDFEELQRNNVESFKKNIPEFLGCPEVKRVKKKDPVVILYKASRKMMTTKDFTFPELKDHSRSIPKDGPCQTVDLYKNDFPEFKFDPGKHLVIARTENTDKKLREILEVDLGVKEFSQVPSLTNYYMFTTTTIRKMELNGIPFNKIQFSEDLAKAWKSMPIFIQQDWQTKTDQVKEVIGEHKNYALESSQMYLENIKEATDKMEQNKLPDYDLKDIGGYFQSLAVGCYKLADQLRENQDIMVDQKQLESRILDFVLSAMVTATAAWEKFAGLDTKVSTDSLNKLKVIMPS